MYALAVALGFFIIFQWAMVMQVKTHMRQIRLAAEIQAGIIQNQKKIIILFTEDEEERKEAIDKLFR